MDYIISDIYDGKKRKLYLKYCIVCNKEMYIPKHVDKKYCSVQCRGRAKQNRESVTCAFCGVKFYKRKSSKVNSKSGLYFCTREHKDAAQRIDGISEIHPRHYKDSNGIYSYREFAFRKYGRICMSCGIEEIWNNKPIILDVHHVDGDRNNNKVENLKVLCPNCHRQEEMIKWGR